MLDDAIREIAALSEHGKTGLGSWPVTLDIAALDHHLDGIDDLGVAETARALQNPHEFAPHDRGNGNNVE